MMSASKFKSKSNIFLHRRHNPIIKDIDKLLKEYGKSKSENRKMKCLVYIYMMCKHYFHTKPDGKRGDAVKDLMDQVKLVLDSNDFKQQISAKAGGRHYSGGIKRDAMLTNGKSATGLSGGYTFEGILPQKNFIEKMKLNMNSILGTDQSYFGVSLLSEKLERNLIDNQDMQPADAAKAAHKMMTTLPFSQILDQLHAMWTDPMDKNGGVFEYLNSSQRTQYMVKFNRGRLHWLDTDTPIDTGTTWGDAVREVIYAIDCSERLYVLAENGAGTKYNHSSVLSGQPVICAGEIGVQQGRLKSFNNNSGHYKPDTDNLYDAVKILQYNHVDMRSFTVSDMKTDTDYNTAAAFIGNARGGGRLLQ